MRKLIAKYPVLLHSHTFQIGEALPTDDIENIKLWRQKGVADWEVSESDTTQDQEKEGEQSEELESETEAVISESNKAEKKVVKTADKSKSTKKTETKPKVPTGRNNKK